MSTFSFVNALTQLHIDTNYPSPATARVAVSGEVDLATAPVLRHRLLGVLRDHGPTMLSVDLAGVTFLDCTGINALIAARNAAAATGRQMWVTHPQPIVRQVLDVTGLLDVFTAPIEQPQPAAGDLDGRPGLRSTVAAQLPGLIAAA
jgi:anti-anti-sigma factor